MKLKNAILIACLMVSIVFASWPVNGLRVEGAIWQEDVNPGDKISYEITISIDSNDTPANFTVDVAGLKQTSEGVNYPAGAENDTTTYSARPILTANPSDFHLEPGGSQIISAEADIPDDIGSGTRYAIISLTSKNDAPTSDVNGGSSVGVSVGSNIPVVFTIKDSEMEKTGEITELKADQISSEHQNVSLVFKNTGNTHYKAKARAELSSENGSLLTSAETPMSFSSIVPTFSRAFDISLIPTRELEPGTYIIRAMVESEDGIVLSNKEIQVDI